MPEARGRVILEQFTSQALHGNPHGDPHVRTIPVYLPPGYETSDRRFPVIYWLPGFGQTALSAIGGSGWIPSLPMSMDRVIREGTPEALLVMVDGFTRFGGAQYLNSMANGRYEDYIVDELIPYIDRTYRTLTGRDHRGVAGKSSGGYGALALAMRHPEIFTSVASHSGDIYFEACFRPLFWEFLNQVNKLGGMDKYLDDFLTLQKKDYRAYVPALSMCYSPNPNRPPYYFDLPVDTVTGELIPEVWARWTALDPVNMVQSHRSELRAMKIVYFDCGNRDQYFGHYGARLLSRRLTALDVAHEYQEYEDDHLNVNYRYVESLHRLSVALA